VGPRRDRARYAMGDLMKVKTYTYFVVILDGNEIYWGMGKQEAKAFAKLHGGYVISRKGIL
jgi:hypothetical protein